MLQPNVLQTLLRVPCSFLKFILPIWQQQQRLLVRVLCMWRIERLNDEVTEMLAGPYCFLWTKCNHIIILTIKIIQCYPFDTNKGFLSRLKGFCFFIFSPKGRIKFMTSLLHSISFFWRDWERVKLKWKAALLVQIGFTNFK